MIRDTVESIGNLVLDGIGRASSRVQERRPLPVDLLESDDAYLAVFDAPGATASDVQVRFDDRTVRVRIDRFREFHEGFEMRLPGRGLSLDGRVRLPEGVAVDPENASATLTTNGTIHVRIPKSEDDGSIRVDTEEDTVETGTTTERPGVDAMEDSTIDTEPSGGTSGAEPSAVGPDETPVGKGSDGGPGDENEGHDDPKDPGA